MCLGTFWAELAVMKPQQEKEVGSRLLERSRGCPAVQGHGPAPEGRLAHQPPVRLATARHQDGAAIRLALKYIA